MPDDDLPTTALLARGGDGGPRRSLRIFGDGIYVVVPLPEAGVLTIGRSAECDVVVNERSISRRHAVLHIGAELQIEDAGSANGIRVGKRELAAGEVARLAHGEIVQIGALFAAVELPDAPDARAEPSVPSGLHDRIDAVERTGILDALAACGGNQSEAARRLGISRSTLISRLERYGVPRPRK
ncbi:MAG TPA: FHA domain-containing protein [Kofleriaceae bacterium]|jgi:transcriptional regulator with GAF, ATPase, and Fis domain|nr:FHA domain-containing protein [Kofleriaceae bacterium]